MGKKPRIEQKSIISVLSTVSILSTKELPLPHRRRCGFTLVEMLVVVLIMALLVGLLIRTLGGAGEQSDKAVTHARVEKLKAALEEFYAEYGQYPPVPFYEEGSMTYYDDKGHAQTYTKIQPIYMEYPMQWTGKDANLSGTAKLQAWGNVAYAPPKTRLFTFGLVSFLVPRYETLTEKSEYFDGNTQVLGQTAQWHFFTPSPEDQKRDLNAIERWKPFLDGVISGSESARETHVNDKQTIVDAWDRELRYESLPPHQSYKLWSKGRNGKDEEGRGDDIGVFMNQ